MGLGLDPQCKAWTFGMPDDFISIWPNDLHYLNVLLQDCPAVKLVIDLGTFTGGTAYLFASAMALRAGTVVTFDHRTYLTVELRARFPDNCRFVVTDLLDAAVEPMLTALIVGETAPVLLFCDNGDKPQEMRRFGPLLRPGDVLAVHDWYDEHDNPTETVITPQTAPEWLTDATQWEAVRPDCWSEPHVHVRAWRRQ